jgi:hypothetical protein
MRDALVGFGVPEWQDSSKIMCTTVEEKRRPSPPQSQILGEIRHLGVEGTFGFINYFELAGTARR